MKTIIFLCYCITVKKYLMNTHFILISLIKSWKISIILFLSQHHTVLSKPENDKLSMKNVKEWIKEAKEDAAAHAKNARGRGITPQVQQREMAMSESKKAYVRQMEHYLKTGDWIAQFMGAKENERTIWTCTAMAYNADGTPKRTVGVWYPDIRREWTREMENGIFDETISITDVNFRNNESSLNA